MQVNTIIFSLNRACQLHALLESWRRFVPGPPPKIIYAYTTEEYRRGYEILKKCVPQLYHECWVPQVNFRLDLIAEVENAWHAKRAIADGGKTPSFTMFLVDDIVFRRKVDWDTIMLRLQGEPDVTCYSLRLSPKITHCYSHGGIPTPCPPTYDPATGRFEWLGQPGDWGYPMSTDAHIFRTIDLLPILRNYTSWHNPNTLECAMCDGALRHRPYMICNPDHAITNVPQNLVQGSFANRNMAERGLSAEELNRKYLSGLKIDIDPIIAAETVSCHTEMTYQFIERSDDPDAFAYQPVGAISR